MYFGARIIRDFTRSYLYCSFYISDRIKDYVVNSTVDCFDGDCKAYYAVCLRLTISDALTTSLRFSLWFSMNESPVQPFIWSIKLIWVGGCSFLLLAYKLWLSTLDTDSSSISKSFECLFCLRCCCFPVTYLAYLLMFSWVTGRIFGLPVGLYAWIPPYVSWIFKGSPLKILAKT